MHGIYARDKNTSARLCAKNAGGAYARGGGVFAGHYGKSKTIHLPEQIFLESVLLLSSHTWWLIVLVPQHSQI